MRRNHEIKVRLNDDEFNDLNRKVIKSKLSREEYVRRCFFKSSDKPAPSARAIAALHAFRPLYKIFHI